MEKQRPLFSIIYVNYNSAVYLEESLKSLFLHEDSSLFEVIIVNNDKKEEVFVAKIASQFLCKVINNDENKGFSVAVNQGVRAASSMWVALLNPDTIWPKRQLYQIAEYIKGQDIIFGITLLDENGNKERFGSGKKITFWQLILNHAGLEVFKDKNIDWISGGALFFLKKTWQELSGFDEEYFLYYEDVDFCERARMLGKKLQVLSNFSVVHFRGKSHSSAKKQKKYYRESQMRYFSKFRPWHERFLLKILLYFY